MDHIILFELSRDDCYDVCLDIDLKFNVCCVWLGEINTYMCMGWCGLWLSICCDCLVMYMYKDKDVETTDLVDVAYIKCGFD